MVVIEIFSISILIFEVNIEISTLKGYSIINLFDNQIILCHDFFHVFCLFLLLNFLSFYATFKIANMAFYLMTRPMVFFYPNGRNNLCHYFLSWNNSANIYISAFRILNQLEICRWLRAFIYLMLLYVYDMSGLVEISFYHHSIN